MILLLTGQHKVHADFGTAAYGALLSHYILNLELFVFVIIFHNKREFVSLEVNRTRHDIKTTVLGM